MDLDAILKEHNRVAVCGGPKTGKTTLCKAVHDRPVYHTDDAMHAIQWAGQPGYWIKMVESRPRFVIEGVQVGRCLRKGLEVDAIVLLDEPHEELTAGQEAMRKGCNKIINEVLAHLPAGVRVY